MFNIDVGENSLLFQQRRIVAIVGLQMCSIECCHLLFLSMRRTHLRKTIKVNNISISVGFRRFCQQLSHPTTILLLSSISIHEGIHCTRTDVQSIVDVLPFFRLVSSPCAQCILRIRAIHSLAIVDTQHEFTIRDKNKSVICLPTLALVTSANELDLRISSDHIFSVLIVFDVLLLDVVRSS
jgi:hypothetical protein